MSSCNLIKRSLFRAIVFWIGALAGVAAFGADLPQQSSQSGGVTIRVKPAEVLPSAATWAFQVVLETHSQDLRDDLVAAATLVDKGGKPHPAAGWDGDPPGGHHRKGVLRFKAPTPRPDAIELRIQRPGEDSPRVFRWQLK